MNINEKFVSVMRTFWNKQNPYQVRFRQNCGFIVILLTLRFCVLYSCYLSCRCSCTSHFCFCNALPAKAAILLSKVKAFLAFALSSFAWFWIIFSCSAFCSSCTKLKALIYFSCAELLALIYSSCAESLVLIYSSCPKLISFNFSFSELIASIYSYNYFIVFCSCSTFSF